MHLFFEFWRTLLAVLCPQSYGIHKRDVESVYNENHGGLIWLNNVEFSGERSYVLGYDFIFYLVSILVTDRKCALQGRNS